MVAMKIFSALKMSLSALSNIRILDFSRILAAPYASMILSDLGATVWKVEKPGVGDGVRKFGPATTPGGDSCYHVFVNRNKKSIAIDLKHPEGKRLARGLASKCDVIIENFKPGTMKKFGLDYDTLAKENKGLIYCSVTGFGPDGPYATRPGYDVIAEAIGGFMHVNAPVDGPPQHAGVAVIDMITGLYAHGAILTALLQRKETGKGQKIECNLLASQIATLLNAGSNYLNAGIKDSHEAVQNESILPYQSFKTRDGQFLVVAVGSDKAFQKLCKLIGLAKLAFSDLYKTSAKRIENKEFLLEILSKRFSERTLKQWVEKVKDDSVACAPVNNLEEAFADPQVKHLNLVQEMYHEKMGPMRVIGPVVRFSEAVNRIRSPPPVLGEHTKEVLTNELSVSEDELEELRRLQVIQY